MLKDVHYFDGTHKLDQDLKPELRDLINARILSLKEESERKLKTLHLQNTELKLKIQKFQALNDC